MVTAVLVAGSEKATAHRLGLSHSTVKRHLANARTEVRAMIMHPFAPPGERMVEGGCDEDGATRVDLGPRLPEPEGMDQPDD